MKIATLNPNLVAQPSVSDELAGSKVEYRRDENGKVIVPANSDLSRSLGSRLKDTFRPANYAESVSADYGVTRSWQFVHDVAGLAAGTVASSAVGSVTEAYLRGPVMSGVLAATGSATAAHLAGASTYFVGAGLSLFALNNLRDYSTKALGLVSANYARSAEKNPRAWILGGEIISNACTVADASTSLIPGALVPVMLGTALIRTISGAMQGAASANIGVRQAKADNLGEVNLKNGNQTTAASYLGGGGAILGLAFLAPHQAMIGAGLSHAVGPAAAHLVMAAGAPLTAAALTATAVFSMGKVLKNLDFHPVTEAAVEKIVTARLDHGLVVGPERGRVWGELRNLRRADKHVLGASILPLYRNEERFKEVVELYRGRNYLLDVEGGQARVILRKGCQPLDRLQASYQAFVVEHLRESAGAKGDRWLVEESLRRTPADMAAFGEELKAAGWSTDLIRIPETEQRSQW